MELFKATLKTFALVFKRLYDILTTYLLFWVLYFATVSAGLHYGLNALWEHFGIANPELLWAEAAARWGLEVADLKLVFFAAMQALLLVLLRRPIRWLQPFVEGIFDRLMGAFEHITRERLTLRVIGESMFSVVVSALLIPFVLQPTLVRGHDLDAWRVRATNLANGQASVEIIDSVFGFYHRFYARPFVARGVEIAEVDAAIAESSALEDARQDAIAGVPHVEIPGEILEMALPSTANSVMDRWDDEILLAVADDPELFAYVKAFMYVESAGRQFAVSRTGCSGLMQFCAGTARSQPYRGVFGRGQVYACECKGRCEIPREVQRVLESGSAERIEEVTEHFPCEITDARFDPNKAIGAGKLYIERLHRAFGGNVYLMYVGYNSGPAVAKKVWRSVGENPEASIEEIGLHLTEALRPHYGSSSEARARSLTKVHLPKIKRALDRYDVQSAELTGADVIGSPVSMRVSR